MELKNILYITVNLCNGKFYFGVHRTNPEVFDGYIGDGIYRQSCATKDVAFHRAVRKYGYDNFRRTTIKIFPDTEEGRREALALEAEIVNNTLLKSKNCYNTLTGGGGGDQCPEQNKRVYQFDLKGNYLRSFVNVREAAEFIGHDDIFTTLKAIRNNCLNTSKSAHGYYWSYTKEFNYKNNDRLRKVAQYTISGKFLRYYDSLAEAERELQISTIDQAIRKKYTSGGYQWRYYEGDDSDISTLISLKNKNMVLPIKMFDKDMNFIKEYNCVNDCVKENPSLSASQINRVLNKIIKTHKGFIFTYKDEDIVQSNQK